MKNFSSMDEMLNHFDYSIKTRSDAKRAEIAWHMYTTNYRGDGCYGCIAELLTATANSHKMSVSAQGKNDNIVRYENNNGKIVNRPAERKTNGGRIDNIKAKFIIYSLEVDNSLASRHVSPRIIPTELFLNKLEEFHAVKAINRKGVLDGHGIQPTNKKLYCWLIDECLEYHRDWIYSDEDFQ